MMEEELAAELNGMSMGVSRQVRFFPLLQAHLESQGIKLVDRPPNERENDYWAPMIHYVHNGQWFALSRLDGPSITCSQEQHQDRSAMMLIAIELGNMIIRVVRQHSGPGHPLRNMIFHLCLRSSYDLYTNRHFITTSYSLPSK
jgi:hypothetical protein